LQQNKELRNECSKLKEKLKGSEEARQSLQWSSDALQGEKPGLSTEIESLKRQVTALQEVGTLGAFPLTTTASFENAMSSLQKDRDRLGTPNALVPGAPQEMIGKGKSGSEASGELQPR
ncbi:Golgin subfamily B member 1, partial [Lemmus lemmus]